MFPYYRVFLALSIPQLSLSPPVVRSSNRRIFCAPHCCMNMGESNAFLRQAFFRAANVVDSHIHASCSLGLEFVQNATGKRTTEDTTEKGGDTGYDRIMPQKDKLRCSAPFMTVLDQGWGGFAQQSSIMSRKMCPRGLFAEEHPRCTRV